MLAAQGTLNLHAFLRPKNSALVADKLSRECTALDPVALGVDRDATLIAKANLVVVFVVCLSAHETALIVSVEVAAQQNLSLSLDLLLELLLRQKCFLKLVRQVVRKLVLLL